MQCIACLYPMWIWSKARYSLKTVLFVHCIGKVLLQLEKVCDLFSALEKFYYN